MINFEGMKAEERKQGYPMLPAGGYVAKITNVKIDGQAPDQSLVLRVDVIEGEQAGYFMKRYNHDKEGSGKYPARYKGDYYLRIPNRNNTKALYPESDIKRFNGALWAIESSNPGYHFSGNEKELIGKIVGINMQEGTYNDAPYTVIGQLEKADDVREGKVKLMRPRKPRGDQQAVEPAAASMDPSGFTPVEVGDSLPF